MFVCLSERMVIFMMKLVYVFYYFIYYGVKVALGNRGMTVEAARQSAKDRKEWRALVHM